MKPVALARGQDACRHIAATTGMSVFSVLGADIPPES